MKRPLIIGIGGGHSGSGKTTLASALLACFSSAGERWGAVKYTKTAIYCSIIDDREILCQKDKDTERFFRSGAAEVLWVQSPAEEIEEALPLAMDRLSGLDGIVLEGNSAIEFFQPDVVLFLSGESHRRPKASGKRLLPLADIIIGESLPDGNNEPDKKKDCIVLPDPSDIKTVVHQIAAVMKKKEIEGMLREKAVDGKIGCKDARKIAETLAAPYKDVGAAADAASIKIIASEPGCF